MDEEIYWIWFSLAFGMSNPRKWDIINSHDTVEESYKALRNGNEHYLLEEEMKKIKSTDIKSCELIVNQCRDKGYKMLSFSDSRYPDKLKQLYDPPAILYAWGDVDCLSSGFSAAIVGSRNASNYSLSCTERISAELAENDVTIVSGFANGIDRAAHIGALSARGKTVAVLGSGIAYDYPKGSMSIKRQIASNGVVISEYLPYALPAGTNFPHRNRILAALSDCVIVTQAAKRSGALNTVSHALELGREVFCMPPHDIYSHDYEGLVGLLRDGANQLFSSADVIKYLRSMPHWEE